MPVELDKLLSAIGRPRRLLIVTHDNPDPDAVVSATALARLAQTKAGIRSRICCEGIIGRAENRALAKALRVKLMSASRVNWSKWPALALVDGQPWTGNNAFPPRRLPDVVIDHHPARRRTRGRFLDIRPEYGACATMMAEYLEAAGVPVPSDLAAGMCYAISSETRDFSRGASPADEQTYLRLYAAADKRMLSTILHPRLKHDYYATMARAILSAFTHANIIGSHLGRVDHPDSVSLIADLLLRHERMGWSFVTGQYKGALYVSLRSLGRRAHAGTALRRLLARQGQAGGHGTMAGGRLPLNGLTPEQVDDLKQDLVCRFLKMIHSRPDAAIKPLVTPDDLPRPLRASPDAAQIVDDARGNG